MTRFSSVFIRVNLGAVKLWYLAIQIAHRSSPFIKLICDVNLTFQVKRLESSQPTEHPEFYLPNQENLLYTRILEIECDKKIQDALIFAPKKKKKGCPWHKEDKSHGMSFIRNCIGQKHKCILSPSHSYERGISNMG